MSRRASTGFELLTSGYGTGQYADVSTEAARTGRLGLTYRKSSGRFSTFACDGIYGAGGNTLACFVWCWSVWFRVRTFGSGEDQIAAVEGLGVSPAPCVITLDSVNQVLKIYSVGNANWAGRSLVTATSAFGDQAWYKFTWGNLRGDPGAVSPGLPGPCPGQYDFILSDAGNVSLWSKQVEMGAGVGPSLDVRGMGRIGSPGAPNAFGWDSVVLGHQNLSGAPAQSGLELDYDDLVIEDGNTTGYHSCNDSGGPPGYDVGGVAASQWGHYRLDATAVGAGAGWSLTDPRQVQRQPAVSSGANREIVSAVASDPALLTTPAPDTLGYPGPLRAATVGAYWRDAQVGTAGYRVLSTSGGTQTRTRTVATGTVSGLHFPPPDTPFPFVSGDPLTFGVIKPADSSSASVNSLGVEIESPSVILSPAYAVGSPSGVVQTITGLYTGNATFQTITLGFRPDWLFIAQVGGSIGILWWDSMLEPHASWSLRGNATDLVQVEPTGFTVLGAAGEVNTNASTYRYVAIQDPTKRMLYRGAFAFLTGEVGPRTVGGLLPFTPSSSWVPLALWCQVEEISGSTSNGAFLRGPGHTSGNSSPLSAAEVTTGITSAVAASFAVGSSLTKLPQTAWCGWANAGWTTPAVPLWTIRAYMGDGTGSQVVALALGGRAPGWVLVVPHNANSVIRHLSHTGTNSSLVGGGNTTTGVTSISAADQMTVGSTLNATGVLYEVIAIAVGDAAGVPPGSVVLTDPAPPDITACLVSFPAVADSGGGSGCAPVLGPGSDSGGGSGCGVSL